MRRIATVTSALALAVLAVVAFGQAQALEPVRSGQDSFVLRAAVSDGRLWLLSDSGRLSSVALDSFDRTEENLPEPVADICSSGSVLDALVRDSHEKYWNLMTRRDGRWQRIAIISDGDRPPSAMACEPNEVLVLADRRLVRVSGQTQSAITLAKRLPVGIESLYASRDNLYVGLDRGEWGGGLLRIDRRTGKIAELSTGVNDGCNGPLNPMCDPVNAIGADPWSPDCLVAAIGLVHFEAHGRIIRVCGNRIETMFSKPYARSSTVAFFGLISEHDALTAVGTDGIYRIRRNGTASVLPFPKFENAGGIDVSFGVSGMVLVFTEVNRRTSVSRSAPMVVARP